MVELLGNSNSINYYENINNMLEIAGRCCYLSYDKIKPGSAGKFITNVIKTKKHESVAGHAYFNITILTKTNEIAYELAYKLFDISNGNIQLYVNNRRLLLGVNWRSIKQMLDSENEIGLWLYWYLRQHINNILFYDVNADFFKPSVDFYKNLGIVFTGFNPDLSEFTDKIQKRFSTATFKFSGYNRTFSHQLIRHMGVGLKNVYSEMSQRYVDPTIKNNKDLYSVPLPVQDTELEQQFHNDMKDAVENYQLWLGYMKDFKKENPNADFAKPGEVARDILPNAINTEIAVTMTLESWQHFIKLRTDKNAQYHIRDAANKTKIILKKEGLL